MRDTKTGDLRHDERECARARRRADRRRRPCDRPGRACRSHARLGAVPARRGAERPSRSEPGRGRESRARGGRFRRPPQRARPLLCLPDRQPPRAANLDRAPRLGGEAEARRRGDARGGAGAAGAAASPPSAIRSARRNRRSAPSTGSTWAEGEAIVFEFAALSFLHRQVRSMVARWSMSAAGRWTRRIQADLEATDHSAFGRVARTSLGLSGARVGTVGEQGDSQVPAQDRNVFGLDPSFGAIARRMRASFDALPRVCSRMENGVSSSVFGTADRRNTARAPARRCATGLRCPRPRPARRPREWSRSAGRGRRPGRRP